VKVLQMADKPNFLNVFKLFHEKAIEENGAFPIQGSEKYRDLGLQIAQYICLVHNFCS